MTAPANRTAVLFSVFLTYIVFAILLNSVGTVILQVIRNYEVTKAAASVLEGFKDLPIAFVSLLCAPFLPRFGFRKSMMVGLLLVAVACAAMPLLPGFWMTKLLFLTVGVSFALVKVSTYATLGLLARSKKQHASLMSTLEGIFMIGVLGGYWLFGAFIDTGDDASTRWLNVYWVIVALAGAAILSLALTRFDESDAQHETQAGLLITFIEMFRLMKRQLAIVFVISAFLYVLIEQGIGTWLPTFNNEILHLPSDMSVQAASIYAACLAAGRLSAGALMHRFNWYVLMNLCLVAMAVLVLISMPLTRGLSPDPGMTWLSAPLAAYVFPLIGLFMAPIYPTINSVMLSALPKYQHSAMTGLIVVFSALGGTTGSLITGLVFGRFSGQTAFYLSLIPLAGILIALFFFRRESERVVHEDHPDVSLHPADAPEVA